MIAVINYKMTLKIYTRTINKAAQSTWQIMNKLSKTRQEQKTVLFAFM